MQVLLLILLAVFQVTVTDYLISNPDFYQLDAYTWESDQFRAMNLGERLAMEQQLDLDVLTSMMIEEEYDLRDLKKGEAIKSNPLISKRRPVEYRKLLHAYEAVFGDLQYFPVPASSRPETPDVVYENGWMDGRTYGGERRHEGCDIMGMERERGFYPVVSITDGVVEKVGWLEQGGWRIGVRAPKGLYLYYAHLYDYSREWKEGDQVRAGELLGFMGDTGYSAVEGTVGNFQVHLHMGMYLRTDHYEEMSINPYWILRYLEKRRLVYQY
ncbi:MAG: M23 family metallopeptidase [Hungatella sp.]|nr:M23 family metallopeptidase [Hungatella sp.]